MNPPQLNLLAWPLATMPLPLAAEVFRVVNVAAIVAAVLLVLSPRELATRRGGWVLLAALTSPALVMQIGAGQVAGLLSLAAALAWRASVTDQWLAQGAAIGALCALKPFFAPVAMWLLMARRWRAAATATATAASLVLVSIALWGVQPQVDWLHAMGSVTWFDSRFNMGWAALAMRTLGISDQPARSAIVATSLLLAVIVAVASARTRPAQAILQVCTASVLATPLGWLYYLCVPGPLLMRRAYDGVRWPALAWLLWIPLPLIGKFEGSVPMRWTLGSAYAWGLLALVVSIYRRSKA